jgi:hypothetical protein
MVGVTVHPIELFPRVRPQKVNTHFVEVNRHEKEVRSVENEGAEESLREQTQATCHNASFRGVLIYFRTMADQVGIPYQSLINLYLRNCVVRHRQIKMAWPES